MAPKAVKTAPVLHCRISGTISVPVLRHAGSFCRLIKPVPYGFAGH
ncbi:hypothetical protein [Thermoanaerobacter pentosaceus]|uniref:Uncharacterized protein n=1 Tax=Thermoanaerobacter pentosaceus TaxID=694059 RepID=A0ABT9M2Q2_9THEO|nr:hypothetical protein [Thermoanaerobacter pentosaceus]MDP9750404.1 hypothetical protein [Thermoanaerobacter pentosaceus]